MLYLPTLGKVAAHLVLLYFGTADVGQGLIRVLGNIGQDRSEKSTEFCPKILWSLMAIPLCLLPGLLRDLCAAKTPSVLLFPSKNQKVDVQVRKWTKTPERTPWNHGRENALCFYLYLHELSSESAHIEFDKSLSCLGKVRDPPPPIHSLCSEEFKGVS